MSTMKQTSMKTLVNNKPWWSRCIRSRHESFGETKEISKGAMIITAKISHRINRSQVKRFIGLNTAT